MNGSRGILGKKQLSRIILKAGFVEAIDDFSRIGWCATLSSKRLTIEFPKQIKRQIGAHTQLLPGSFHFPSRLVVKTLVDFIEIRQVINHIRVAGGTLEPAPIKRQPILHAEVP